VQCREISKKWLEFVESVDAESEKSVAQGLELKEAFLLGDFLMGKFAPGRSTRPRNIGKMAAAEIGKWGRSGRAVWAEWKMRADQAVPIRERK
jgi:hypothetical protein